MTVRSFAFALALAALASPTVRAGELWSKEKAEAWYKARPVPVGCNYITSSAINQIEMWQADSFDPAAIDRELGWAEGLGFNTVRVFLHDLPLKDDREGFLKRVDRYLEIADRHGIATMLVLLDSVWDPFPKSGPQRAPKPGLHNSGWVQSPGRPILETPARWGEVEAYVKGVIGRFRDDKRVLAWDLMNEPDNTNGSSYGTQEPRDKPRLALDLLKKVYAWAREADPTQPITTGVWTGDWSESKINEMSRFQLEASDVVSFHDYQNLDGLKTRVGYLKRYDRPILCTEYMARPAGSRFDPNLGYLVEQKIGAYNWGFVDGKSQTIYPWDSWKSAYKEEPKVWFHDIFRKDGTPYNPEEVAYIRKVTGKAKP